MLNNPENLSKDRLKEELRRRGIPYSPAGTKESYVSLYKQHFARSSRQQRSEFSSDDDAFKRASGKSPIRDRKLTKVLNIEHFMSQLAPVSDSQLRKKLKQHNVDVGPITDSTRSLYKKKLARLMAEKAKVGGVSNSSSGVTIASGSDEEFSSDSGVENSDQIKPVIVTPRPQIKQIKPEITSYSLRSRSHHQHRVVQTQSQYKPLNNNKPKTIQENDNETTHNVDVVGNDDEVVQIPSTERRGWFTVWNIVEFLLLIVCFLAGLIIFDYIYHGDSRFVQMAMYKFGLKQLP